MADWRGKRTAGQCLAHLCLNETMADVHFLFQTDTGRHLVPAHKFVLSMRSPVFETMFYGSLPEESGEVLISDIKLETFETVLRFLYTDSIQLTPAIALECLYAADKYCLDALMQTCISYLETTMNFTNACTIMNQAHIFNIKTLKTQCQRFICKNAEQVVQTNGFATLSWNNLQDILQSDELDVQKESVVFSAALTWAYHQCKQLGKACTPANIREVLGAILYTVRFPLVPLPEFTEVVVPTGVLTQDEELELYRCMSSQGQKFQSTRFLGTQRKNSFELVIRNIKVATGRRPQSKGGQTDAREVYGGQFALIATSKRKLEKILLITDGKSLPKIVCLYQVTHVKGYDKEPARSYPQQAWNNTSQAQRWIRQGARCSPDPFFAPQGDQSVRKATPDRTKETLVEKCNVGIKNEVLLTKGIVLEEGQPTTIKITVLFHNDHSPREECLVDSVEKLKELQMTVSGTNSWVHSLHFRKT